MLICYNIFKKTHEYGYMPSAPNGWCIKKKYSEEKRKERFLCQ